MNDFFPRNYDFHRYYYKKSVKILKEKVYDKEKKMKRIENVLDQIKPKPIRDSVLKMKIALLNEIEESRNRILSLEDNWNREGYKAYKKETFYRVSTFLKQLYKKLIDEYGVVIQIPAIGPSSDGSIDVHWKTKKFELLLNIPEDPQEYAGFYGDNYGNESIEGNFNLFALQDVLIRWLITKV
ncbi:MAG: hypothetical protein ACTSPY_18075 [Candidatus Helarchaeota archaeon]